MIKVLFVCLGNICRSPMADGIFQEMVRKAGLSDQIMVDSAGTGNWHVGEYAHRGTLNILKQQGIDYKGRARQVQPNDFNNFHYILAMDYSNLVDLKRLAPNSRAEIDLFLNYAQQTGTIPPEIQEVPDPYYNGRFEEVSELVEKGSRALLDYLRAKHNL